MPNVESLAFNYDAANRMTGITNGMDGAHSETLGYDALNRLVSETGSAENESYQYDPDGNRTTQTVNGVHVSFDIAPDSNQLDGWSRSSDGWSELYNYDQEGDLVSYSGGTGQPPAPSQMFYYDGFNRWWGSDVNGVFMWQDISPEGERLRKYTADTKTYFAPDANGTLLAEDQEGDWMDYVWLNGRVVTVISNGGVFPLHDDQTGRPLYMTDPTSGGQIDWAAQGLPFDRNVTTNHWGDFNVGFPGQYWDAEDELWHNGNRDYDASLGRYIESDPIGLEGGVNTYVYADGNPISNTDPQGKLWITAAIGAFTGGIAGYETGGWKGAIAGGVVGAAVGFFAPEYSEEAGGGVGAMFATTAADVALNAAGGGAATIGANLATEQPWDQDLGFGIAIGSFGPLASGEAFFLGAGGADAFGEGVADIFASATGTFNIFGSALISSKDKSNCP